VPFWEARSATVPPGNVVFDRGRDWLMIASRTVDIQPLCAALS
jgi:hypothetical protein